MEKTAALHLSVKPKKMAEIQTNNSTKHTGVRRSKKLSTKVDLTPMVDLGFLLITFFIFTSVVAKPTAMDIYIPDEGDSMRTGNSKTLNIILTGDNEVYYYNGDDLNNMHATNYSPDGLRAIIRSKKEQVAFKFGDGNETVILLKPTDDASYNNIVDAFDELTINSITRYVLMDVDETEKSLLFKH